MIEIDEQNEDPVKIFIIPVLRIIKNAQLQHGLRHGDHQRYRQFLSKKIRRMRKALDFRFGNRAKVTVKKITPSIINDSRYIMMRIFEIERCWAYSMQLKDESSDEQYHRRKFHSRNRLRKAIKLADELTSIVESEELQGRFDSSTMLEIKAYISWINGQFFFDKKQWVVCKDLLETSKKIYMGLCDSIDSEFKDIYVSRCEEMNPQIRYCDYNTGNKNAAEVLKKISKDKEGNEYVDHLLNSCLKKDAEKITQVNWLDATSIPIKVERVKLFILSMSTFEEELKSTGDEDYAKKISIYENSILKGCSEAISALKDEMKLMKDITCSAVADATGDLASMKISSQVSSNIPSSNDKISNLQMLLNYLLWSKSEYVISRNLVQIKNALKQSGVDIISSNIGTSSLSGPGGSGQPKPNELARLYDSVFQSFSELSQINGPPKENERIVDLLKIKQNAYRCFRCYYLALAHFNNKSYVQCLGLIKRSQLHIAEFYNLVDGYRKVEKNDNKIPGDSLPSLISLLEQLQARCQAEELTCKAQLMLQMATKSEKTEESEKNEEKTLGQEALIERSDEFFTEKQVERAIASTYSPFVKIPPPFEPVPMKPVFFDLALNYIDYPSMKMPSNKDKDAENKGGLTGMVKGWLWGS